MKELSLALVGKRLRNIRNQLHLTREQFAERAGISPQFLAEIENGQKGLSADTLYKICTRFHVSADYILLGQSSVDSLSDPIQETFRNFSELQLEIAEEMIKVIDKTVPNDKK